MAKRANIPVVQTGGSGARTAAELLLGVFDAHQAQFRLVTRRAEARFLRRDWAGGQRDATERLTLYRQFVSWSVQELFRTLGEQAAEAAFWTQLRREYAMVCRGRPDAELAYSFVNSVVRQSVRAVGPETGIYFDDHDFLAIPPAAPLALRRHAGGKDLADLCRELLDALPFTGHYQDPAEDARLLAERIGTELRVVHGGATLRAIELVPAPLYRNKGVYLVGRLVTSAGPVPLILALVHGEPGVRVDAALMTSDEAAIVFSFTRSYFQVDLDCPRAMVEFLLTLMPKKPVGELYTSLGCHKHGKTELIRLLLRHMSTTEARFEPAEGDPGLVMAVFAMPSLNVVFKVIRDRFGAPKQTTRQQVMEKYRLVFLRDRVGRLADAQEFEDLEFRRDRFAPAVLEELLAECASSVQPDGDRVFMRHLYTERRVTPLNLYLRQADRSRAMDAVTDFGQAIKDLAAANIFTGDMLLKNFGVTRHGRVIFYDYDELCLLTECNFRQIPAAQFEDDETGAEPWFSVGEHDIFPEEFRKFMSLPGDLGIHFNEIHGDLFTVEFWRRMQQRAEAGEIMDVFPYKPARRLR